LHDNSVGIKLQAGGFRSELLVNSKQALVPQDTLSLQAIGSATAGDVELAMLTIEYEGLAGIDANLIGPAELMARGVNLFGPQLTIVGAAAGWTGSQVITTTDDQYKANQEYAWIGVSQRSVANYMAVGLVSPDWGNLRIGCHVYENDVEMSSQYFVELSRRTGKPCIPVLNASQKSNIFASILQNENNVSPVVSLCLVQLAPKGMQGGARGKRR